MIIPFRLTRLGLIVVLLSWVSIGAMAAPKNPQPNPAASSYIFAGFTDVQVTGADIGELYFACQNFTGNPAARMASTQEYIESPDATVPLAPAWIRPVLVGRVVDYSGVVFDNIDIGCLASGTGVFISTNGTIGTRSCDLPAVVACSIPSQ